MENKMRIMKNGTRHSGNRKGKIFISTIKALFLYCSFSERPFENCSAIFPTGGRIC